jgi:Outer membrane protein beta-barrel domain
MKRLFVLLGFLALSIVPARAQQTPSIELSGGYTVRVYNPPSASHIIMNGWYASGDYNFFPWLGAAAEVSGAYKGQGLDGNVSIYSLLVGPQIYPFRHRHKLTLFVHVLFGEGFYRIHYPAYGGFPAKLTTDTGTSWEAGGGFDLARTAHWEIRLIQADFGQTRFLGSQSQATYRLSVGVVYRFGKK